MTARQSKHRLQQQQTNKWVDGLIQHKTHKTHNPSKLTQDTLAAWSTRVR
jgi:hypothetical protein